jgi:hypothetical protein
MLVGIFGTGRNGSTLLMRLLDGSQGLWIDPVELNYLSGFEPKTWKARVKRRLGRLMEGRYRRTFHQWAAHHLGELQHIYLDKLDVPLQVHGDPLDAVKQRTGFSLAADLGAFLGALQSSYDDRPLASKPHLMFKSIDVAYLQRYDTMFPDMRFVHIVRHPYSNYSSLKRTDMVLKQKPFWFQGGDILRLLIESRWIPHARFFLRRMREEPGRHYLVRYEDLCESPERVVAGICDWLGVPPPKESSVQTVLGGRRMKTLPQNSSQKGVKTPDRVVPNMAGEFAYDDILTERERALIRLRTYDLARQVGYFPSKEEAILPNRLALFRQWIVPDQWEYLNARPKLRLARALAARRLYLCRKLLLPTA